MTFKTTLAAAVLTLLPGLAFAQGCNSYDHTQSASISCAEGTVLDANTNTCVPTTG